jgi:hypothetical protein
MHAFGSDRFSLCAAVLVGLASLTGCRFTDVALVTVRNESNVGVTVHAQLHGEPDLRPDESLAPAEEGALVKYEEPRGAPTPITDLVTRLRFQTAAGCMTRTLEAPGLTAISMRDNKQHRWTIRVTGDLLQKEGCP